MRCECCNKRLSSYEAALKHAETGVYLDTCVKCLDGLGIPVMGNEDLADEAEPDDDITAFNVDKLMGEWDEV
jgi:hypothetical protein